MAPKIKRTEATNYGVVIDIWDEETGLDMGLTILPSGGDKLELWFSGIDDRMLDSRVVRPGKLVICLPSKPEELKEE